MNTKLLVEKMNAKGMSQAQLAKTAGISRFYLNNILKGRKNASFTTAKMISAAVGYKLDPEGMWDDQEDQDVKVL